MTALRSVETLADPAWLAHRYDVRNDAIQFVRLPREARKNASFLYDPALIDSAPSKSVSRSDLDYDGITPAPVHLIMHSGLAGSTLLTKALDIEGVATTFSEPPILTDLMSLKLANRGSREVSGRIRSVLRILARPFEQGEVVVLKSGAVGNALAGDILSDWPESRALCLQSPLTIYLASVARKRTAGRVWGRQLFSTLASAQMTSLGFTSKELFAQTDLQITALAWLALHREMQAALSRFPGRVVALDSEKLLNSQEASIDAIGKFLSLDYDAKRVVANPLLRRHSKTGEDFDSQQRARELDEAFSIHGEEIDLVTQWIVKVAEAQGIVLDLPNRI